jgi:hypothetical protein
MASRHKSGALRSIFFGAIPFATAVFLAAVALPFCSAQTGVDQEGPLKPSTDVSLAHLIGNDTILRMAKAGLSDEVLIQTIQLQPGRYSTAPDDLIALKEAGISDKVISVMQVHGTGLSIRGVSKTGVVTPVAPPAPEPLMPGIDEIGVYYKISKGPQAGHWMPLHTERVVFKSGGAVKSVLTHGIIAKDMNGHVDGPRSALTLPLGVEITIYAPFGTDGAEYDFLRLVEHKDNREFRTLTGGVFHSETGAQRDELEFHPKKIAPQFYTFTVPVDIEKGEYGVLPPGSANTQGIAGTGKIYTFSIVE